MSRERSKRTTFRWAAPVVAVVLCSFVFAWLWAGAAKPGLTRRPDKAAAREPVREPVRTLVVIVPGTWGNESFWPVPVPGKATFGSEVARAVGGGDLTEVYAPVWASGLDHETRARVARQLASDIDAKAKRFDRVSLVGHSHGGNIALMAAGLCRTRIDTVVCLSTPHPHLRAKAADGAALELPVYCSTATRANTAHIVCINPDKDAVPTTWSNELMIGLEENEAIAMCAGWRERHNQPRLADDQFFSRLFESGNIISYPGIKLPDVHNLTYQTFVTDKLGVAPHHAVHSRRMGYVVGQILRDGATRERLEYVRTLIQPASADAGEPVEQAALEQWLKENDAAGGDGSLLRHAGWRLTRVAVKFNDTACAAADDLDDSAPDAFLTFGTADGQKRYLTTGARKDKMEPDWPLTYVLMNGEDERLDVYDDDWGVGTNDPLGGVYLVPSRNGCEIKPIDATPKCWTVHIDREPVHY